MAGTARLLVKTQMETKADRYRQRATELRTIAAGIMDLKARATLIEVAEDYERMAQAADSAALSGKSGATDRPKKPR